MYSFVFDQAHCNRLQLNAALAGACMHVQRFWAFADVFDTGKIPANPPNTSSGL